MQFGDVVSDHHTAFSVYLSFPWPLLLSKVSLGFPHSTARYVLDTFCAAGKTVLRTYLFQSLL